MSELIQRQFKIDGSPMALPTDFLSATFLGTPAYFWLIFAAVVVALLVFDLGVMHRKTREISTKESFILYGFYMAIAFAFGAWVWWQRGAQTGLEFFTGYLIEQSLAMDNIFVIALIFSFLKIPAIYQHRVLFWGVLGVVMFRAILIGFGAALVMSFHWILFLFGAFLLFTGIKMLMKKDESLSFESNPILNWMKKHFRITNELHGEKFLVRLPDPKTGIAVLYLTPLMLALVLVEIVDVIFAVDSVPAIFAITTDPFVVYTSNIFAVLGLRSLYFALAAATHRFKYLQYSLAVILMLVGIKVFLVPLGIKVDTALSLAATVSILAAGVLYSLWKTREPQVKSL
jgi:tellurite resistance protein TerC